MFSSDVAYNFAGRRFIVTGASSGMGRQVAKDLAGAGGIVLAVARRESRLAELSQEYGTNIVAGIADVCDYNEVDRVINNFVAEHGKINGAVHAAGIFESTPLRTYDEEKARRVMDVSFWAGIHLMKVINTKRMSEHGCSSVLFSSVSAYIGEKSLFAYSASKAAMQIATRTVAKEIYPTGNRINTISPGWVDTEMTKKELNTTAVSPKILDRHLLGIGNVEDISPLVLFLLSRASRWVTGVDFPVDGGYLGGGV